MSEHSHPPTSKHEITLTAEQHDLRVQVHAQAIALIRTMKQIPQEFGEQVPCNQFFDAIGFIFNAVQMLDHVYFPEADDVFLFKAE